MSDLDGWVVGYTVSSRRSASRSRPARCDPHIGYAADAQHHTDHYGRVARRPPVLRLGEAVCLFENRFE